MTFKPYHDPTHLYFVTATLVGWQPLFVQLEYARIVLDSLDWHRRNSRWNLYAYVVMPNHMHSIVKPCVDQTISSVLQSFGSFTAHSILARLRTDQRDDVLTFFAQRREQDASERHQIWQPMQAKNITSLPFLREKLDYIHNNPVAKKWHLVDDRAEYIYSSACFYDRGIASAIQVDNIQEWLE
jgi:putative transposase